MLKLKVLITIIIIGLLYYLYETNQRLQKELSIVINNSKAYEIEHDSVLNQSRIFKMTIDDLEYKNDSISKRLIHLIDASDIKSKRIEELTYMLTEATMQDSVVLTDTIFRDQDFTLDTIVGDKWVNVKMHLSYPGIIKLEPTFISEQAIIVSSKRETIRPPKKFFLARWFQKKHTVLDVTVVSSNPYESNRTQRFIKILK